MDIDLVYLWVNGNDPKWMAKRVACVGELSGSQENCKGRYVDNDELRYSLRSVDEYAPWIRKIFIVTDNQVPEWLDTSNPKIQIVDHTEIMPAECLPCFNSSVILHHLCMIPGLSEHFLYADDDMYINKPVVPEVFFADDSLPYIRLNRKFPRKLSILFKTKIKRRPLKNHKQMIHNAALLVEKKYGTYYNGKAHHNIDAYLKSTFLHARQVFDKEIGATLCNHKRSSNDIERILYSYVALAEKRGHLLYVNQHTSFRLNIDDRKLYRKFEKYKPVLFCMNDSEYADDDDRKFANEYIKKLFPKKSQFEK